MMESKLRRYLYWKGRVASQKNGKSGTSAQPEKSAPKAVAGGSAAGRVSEALQKKDKERAARRANRRRIRGGGPSSAAPSHQPKEVIVLDDNEEIVTL